MDLRALLCSVFVVVMLTLAGCSGGGSGSSNGAGNPPPEEPPPDDDDPPPPDDTAATISTNDITVDEGSASASFIVRLEGSSSEQVMVDYATADGSAVENGDYLQAAGTLSFDGAGEQTVEVDVVDDSEPEPDETFNLELSNPLNAEIENATAVATIVDDDSAAACGAPAGADTDPGAYLWKDCATGVWQLRVTGEGGDTTFEGSIAARVPFDRVAPVSTESGDVIDNSSTDEIVFALEADSDTDGIEFEPVEDAGTCFSLTSPAGASILVGADSSAVTGPFDLHTLESCEPSELNVVVLFTDDQRFDTLEHMPTVVSRLLPDGVVFENAYVPTPLCCPARASTFSGGFLAQNTGALWNFAPNGGMVAFDDSVNIGTRLQDAGYRSAFVGKWLNDYPSAAPYVPPGWDLFLGRAVFADTADWSNFRYIDGSTDAGSGVGDEVATDGQYHVYFERDRIVDFIESTPAQQPLFVFWSTTPPHAPMTPDAPDEAEFADFTYRDRGYGETDLSDKPEWVQSRTDEEPPGDDELVRDQLRSLLAVDRSLGDVMDVLSDQGRLENTVFIVTSDNGYLWGEHGLWGKNKAYEESVRVPFLVVMPGIEPRSDDSLVAATLDLGATLYEIAGVDAPSDGMSVVPLLEDPGAPWRDELFFEKYSPALDTNALWAGVRDGDWKYVEYWDGESELYDLATDPYELENLVDDPSHAATRDRLAEQLEEQRGLAIRPVKPWQAEGAVGEPYELDLENWGGEPPLTWSMETGSLPPGLDLDDSTGIISGTPTTAGTWTIRVRVTDSGEARQTGEPRRYISHEIDIAVE